VRRGPDIGVGVAVGLAGPMPHRRPAASAFDTQRFFALLPGATQTR
jgi:hypothetical protein